MWQKTVFYKLVDKTKVCFIFGLVRHKIKLKREHWLRCINFPKYKNLYFHLVWILTGSMQLSQPSAFLLPIKSILYGFPAITQEFVGWNRNLVELNERERQVIQVKRFTSIVTTVVLFVQWRCSCMVWVNMWAKWLPNESFYSRDFPIGKDFTVPGFCSCHQLLFMFQLLLEIFLFLTNIFLF